MKVKMSVFVPLTACGCAYSHFLDEVMNIILPYRPKIEFEIKDAASKEAEQLEIFQMAIVLEHHPQSEKPITITKLDQLEPYLSVL
jgi:hypothetical protein